MISRRARAKITPIIVWESLRHENLGEIETRWERFFRKVFSSTAAEKFVFEVNRNSKGIEKSFILMDFGLIIRGKRKSDLIYAVLVDGSTRKRLQGPEHAVIESES